LKLDVTDILFFITSQNSRNRCL